jgi:hypothetical protein
MLLFLWLACSGSDSSAPVPDPAPAAPKAAEIACPEGTALETGQTAKGTEYWCDRGGMMHGPYLRLYPSGQRAVKGRYDNNLPDGDWIWWHDNETEAQKGKYVKGKQTGPWTWWHPNGHRAEEGDFLAGRKAGQWVSWFESGVKKDEGIYHNGMKNGVWTYYTDTTENTVDKTERWENGGLVEENGKPVVPEGGQKPDQKVQEND